MKRVLLLGIIFIGLLSSLVFGEDDLHLDSKKYPMVGMYLEGINLNAKTQRETGSVVLSGLGGVLLVGGLTTNNDKPQIKQTYLALGGTYLGVGILASFVKSKYEVEIGEYLKKIADENMNVEEREKIAVQTLGKIVKEQQLARIITGGILAGYGAVSIFTTPKEYTAANVGLGLLGVYSVFMLKTPDEAFLESYNKQNVLESKISLNVEPVNDGAKLSLAYSF